MKYTQMFALKLNLSLYKYMLRKIKINIITAVTFLGLLFLVNNFVVASGGVVVSQIQTNGPGTGTSDQEFIEIYNNSDISVKLSGWQLRYVSSTGSLKPIITFKEDIVIHPKGYLVTATEAYDPLSTKYARYKTDVLSLDGASVDLLNANGDLVDRVGYGLKAYFSETSPTVAPEKSGSIIRKINDGLIIDTDNNFNDFEILLVSNPRTSNEIPLSENVIEPTPEEPGTGQQGSNDGGQGRPGETNDNNVVSAPAVEEPKIKPMNIQISELMIDPEFPLVDSSDEWIEIYNPNDSEIDLSGYRFETGNTGSYKYTVQFLKMAPRTYLIIKSLDTPISLSNTSGKVSIFDNANVLIDSVSYTSVEPGLTYAKDSFGIWQWTTTPTQNSENIITFKISPNPALIAKNIVKAPAKAKAASTSKTKSTTKSAAPVKAAKSKAVKATQVKSDQTQKPLIEVANPIPNSLVAILVVVAIIYSVYEYRYEIRNKFSQFRFHR